MRVRTEIEREIVFDVRQLSIERDEQLRKPRKIGVAIGGEELHRPRPRETPEAELQHAGPVDALERRIDADPVAQVRDERLPVPRLAREPRRDSQRDEILVTVDLPD